MGKRAIIVVDVQKDFCEGGSLAVAGGNSVAEAISHYLGDLEAKYDLVVLTRDWHIDPGSHFASNVGQEPDFNATWPDHCVAGQPGSSFSEFLDTWTILDDLWVVSKGQDKAAYSGFEGVVDMDASYFVDDPDGETRAELNGVTLADLLAKHDISDVDVVGIATDFCVAATAYDAAANGLNTSLLLDLTAWVNWDNVPERMAELTHVGVCVTHSQPPLPLL